MFAQAVDRLRQHACKWRVNASNSLLVGSYLWSQSSSGHCRDLDVRDGLRSLFVETRRVFIARVVQVRAFLRGSMIEFSCDKCGKKYQLVDKFAGSTVNCAQCGEHLRVPGNRPQSEHSAPKRSTAERSPILRAAKQLGKSTAEIKADKYPWLRGYIGWLRFWAYSGNLIGMLMIVFGFVLALFANNSQAQGQGWSIAFDGVWVILGFNFLFVTAELIRLLLDAKNELTVLVENSRAN